MHLTCKYLHSAANPPQSHCAQKQTVTDVHARKEQLEKQGKNKKLQQHWNSGRLNGSDRRKTVHLLFLVKRHATIFPSREDTEWSREWSTEWTQRRAQLHGALTSL